MVVFDIGDAGCLGVLRADEPHAFVVVIDISDGGCFGLLHADEPHRVAVGFDIGDGECLGVLGPDEPHTFAVGFDISDGGCLRLLGADQPHSFDLGFDIGDGGCLGVLDADEPHNFEVAIDSGDGCCTPAQCTQTCTAGYTDNNSGNGQAYTGAVGTFAGTLLTCTTADCSSTVPSGAGLSTNFIRLVTDASECTQTCSAGCTDNNSGNGQAYTCAVGTFAGTLLTCTAADCSSTVLIPNGAGLSTNCEALVTGATVTVHPDMQCRVHRQQQ